MNENGDTPPALPDFVALRERYERMTPGQRAQLGKRVGSPDDLVAIPAFYHLFPGKRPSERDRHIAFLLPYCPQADDAKPLGTQLAMADVSEARLFQVVRAEPPNDLIQLRRLVQHVQPAVDWREFGKALFYWNDLAKRRLLEDFFITHTK